MKTCTPTARAPGVSVSGMMCSAIVATSFTCSLVSARHVPSALRESHPASTPAIAGAERTPPRSIAARRSASRRSTTSCDNRGRFSMSAYLATRGGGGEDHRRLERTIPSYLPKNLRELGLCPHRRERRPMQRQQREERVSNLHRFPQVAECLRPAALA